ncbi:hypothetical protein BASA83_009237 [Batrachochytrium salamandrivorans]|nr:hypothetical protein BASA83_009237 [Batrachochytrium salamandrivorans]
MEKLVADLSARIKSLEKESIILQKEAQESRAYSQPCHTGISNYLSDSTTHLQLRATENCNSRNSTIRKSAYLVHPNGRVPRWPFLHSFVLGRLQERHDQYRLPTDLEWNDSALQAQFYWGLNSEVKDALVHFEQPTSLSEAMTLAIKIDNRIQERRREQTQSARPLSQRSSNYVPCPRRAPYQPREPNYQQQQQQQHQLQHQHQLRPEYQTNSSTPPAARQPDYMDVDLVRRGPLSSAERQHRMSQRLCLVCGQAGHIKATCPKSNSKFGTSKSVRAIQTSDNDDETSGNDQGCY